MKALKLSALILSLIFLSCTAVVTSINSDIVKDKGNVFLLHGFASGETGMLYLQNSLEKAGFNVIMIDYRTLYTDVDNIYEEITREIDDKLPESGTINFVGHSLGGLMIRWYLSGHKLERLGRVVLIGTPNYGTPVVDLFRDRWWMKMLGKVPLSLGNGLKGFPDNIGDPYYPAGIIAGDSGLDNEKLIAGADDGVVPVKSAALKGRPDMIVVKSFHSLMRYDQEVARQTITFLKNGKFNK